MYALTIALPSDDDQLPLLVRVEDVDVVLAGVHVPDVEPDVPSQSDPVLLWFHVDQEPPDDVEPDVPSQSDPVLLWFHVDEEPPGDVDSDVLPPEVGHDQPDPPLQVDPPLLREVEPPPSPDVVEPLLPQVEEPLPPPHVEEPLLPPPHDPPLPAECKWLVLVELEEELPLRCERVPLRLDVWPLRDDVCDVLRWEPEFPPRANAGWGMASARIPAISPTTRRFRQMLGAGKVNPGCLSF